MQRAIVFASLLSVGVFGTQCPAGYKHKSDLTGLNCGTNAIDGASCSNCCEKDKTKCGGLTGIVCAWDHYAGNDDVWKNTPATEKTKNTACCTMKVSCANTFVTKPAGKKYKTGADVPTTKCSSDSVSCTEGDTCFEWDATTCGGLSKGVAGTTNGKCTGTANAADAAPNKVGAEWMNTKATGGFAGKCCAANKQCASTVVCAEAGKKSATTGDCTAKDAPAGAKATATKLSTQVADCGRKGGACCTVADPAKCGGYATAKQSPAAGTAAPGLYTYLCAIGYVPAGDGDAWKNRGCNAKQTNDAAGIAGHKARSDACCVPKAKCSQGTCWPGTKPIANLAATTECEGNVASCGNPDKKVGAAQPCCTANVETCGGLITYTTGATLTCGYGTFDERVLWDSKTTQAVKDAWNAKVANSTNKNTNCCTAVAQCALPTGTTTPAATATPAAALKFSKHTVRTQHMEEGSQGTNMVALGVGGFVGLSILMVVKVLRSRMQTAAQDDSEDAASLLTEQ